MSSARFWSWLSDLRRDRIESISHFWEVIGFQKFSVPSSRYHLTLSPIFIWLITGFFAKTSFLNFESSQLKKLVTRILSWSVTFAYLRISIASNFSWVKNDETRVFLLLNLIDYMGEGEKSKQGLSGISNPESFKYFKLL